MDFSFSDEQQMLQETTRRFLASEYSFDKRARILDSDAGWSRDTWKALADLGLLAVDIAESDGGMEAGPVATMLMARAAGEGLLQEPLLSSAILATRIVSRMGSAQQRARWLSGLADGSTIAVLAHEEPGSDLDITSIETSVLGDGKVCRLSGRKSAVYHAPAANLLLVTARGEQGEIGVYAVAADAPGVTLERFRGIDGQCAADILFDNVSVSAADCLPGESGELQAALDYGLAMFCAEALGGLERILDATIEYTGSRVQFGVPIGSFQALQHRMADMLMQVEQARSMVYIATTHCLDPDAAARQSALSGAKMIIGKAARQVSQQAVQLHGGMGMTDELDVSHHFRRLLAFELRHGTSDEHRVRYRQYMQARAA